MQRLLVFIGLQCYAVLLALYQGLSSVRTDEAKYLLDIPYPHPPLLRNIIHATEWLPWQEFFWRFLFATLLVQAVWIVAKMAKKCTAEERLTLCGLWIFSSSVLFQAGTIMMAPITALQGLVFVFILFEITKKGKWGHGEIGGWVALLWLASLFTAYQAVLYGPIVLAIFIRSRVSVIKTIAAIGIPIALVVLYIATNPLAAASFINAGGQNAVVPFIDTVQMLFGSWLWSGSIVLSIIGVISILRSRNVALIGSFVLVCLFLLTSFRPYYAVLFLPLLVGGVAVYPAVLKRSAFLLACQIITTVWIFAHAQLSFYPSPARTVMGLINQVPVVGVVLINGSFGHDWQYESHSPVMRFTPSLLSKAKAVVCLQSCPRIRNYGFYPIENIAKEVWVRRW